MQVATSLFSNHLELSASITNGVRIGKKGTKPRLLKIIVGNMQEKITILRNKMKLRNENHSDYIKSIFITADFTPLEQKQNKMLRDQLKEMNKEGNNYIIKNGSIVQKRV